MRKGRFDEIFLLDLPDAAERRTILDLQPAAAAVPPMRSPGGVVDRTEWLFSGAELEQDRWWRPMHLGFGAHRDFSEADLIPGFQRSLYRCRERQREQMDALNVASSGRRQACLQVGGCNENRPGKRPRTGTKQRKSQLGPGWLILRCLQLPATLDRPFATTHWLWP